MELVIEKLTPGGDGFARARDGRPVFVSGALPGDRVELARWQDKKGYLRAVEWRLQGPSPARREPPCPAATRCGGCDWMALTESAQLDAKRDLLVEALRRTGGFHALPVPLEMRSAGPALGYRQRVRLHFDDAGAMGYFARGSHRLVTVDACLVLAPELERAVAEFDALRREAPHRFGVFSEVEIRAHEGRPSLQFRLRRGATFDPALAARLRTRFAVGVAGGAGGELSRCRVTNDTQLLAAPGDFTQVNWSVNRAIVGALLEGVRARNLRTFLDLYAGVGNFGLPLLRAGLQGALVDENASAIDSARRAAEEQGLAAGQFFSGDVALYLADLPRPCDLVVVDPPRSGIQAPLDRLVSRVGRALFLCACDPVTFARDLRRLVELGLRIESITGWDMFPQTHHFEVTCWLGRDQV